MSNTKFTNVYTFLLFIAIGFILGIGYYFQIAISFRYIYFNNQNLTTNSNDIKVKDDQTYNHNLTIILLTNKKPNMKEYEVHAESIRHKEIYAKKHNYNLFVDAPGPERHPVWYKCISILKAFNKSQPNDWVWMIDADTIVTNMNIQLKRLTQYANKHNYHMIINKSCGAINAGSILFRNSQLSIKFINHVWNSLGKEVGVNDEWREQRAIIVLSEKEAYRDTIMWVPVNCVNSMPIETIQMYRAQCANQTEWRVGDFLVHFAGNHNEKLFFEYVSRANNFTNNDLKSYDTDKWLKFINNWRKENNFSLLF
jgi:hypothetical protein